MRPELFKTDVKAMFCQKNIVDVVFDDRIKEVVASDDRTMKDIGNLGEAMICGHSSITSLGLTDEVIIGI